MNKHTHFITGNWLAGEGHDIQSIDPDLRISAKGFQKLFFCKFDLSTVSPNC